MANQPNILLQGGTQSKTRRLGTACRIYKNAAAEVIAIDSIEVVVSTQQLPSGPILFHRSVTGIHSSRTVLHLSTGASRTVSSIQMIGSYSSIEENGGDYLIITWLGSTANENDVQFSLEDNVSKVGDTV